MGSLESWFDFGTTSIDEVRVGSRPIGPRPFALKLRYPLAGAVLERCEHLGHSPGDREESTGQGTAGRDIMIYHDVVT